MNISKRRFTLVQSGLSEKEKENYALIEKE
jgi:hypothetical protein